MEREGQKVARAGARRFFVGRERRSLRGDDGPDCAAPPCPACVGHAHAIGLGGGPRQGTRGRCESSAHWGAGARFNFACAQPQKYKTKNSPLRRRDSFSKGAAAAQGGRWGATLGQGGDETHHVYEVGDTREAVQSVCAECVRRHVCSRSHTHRFSLSLSSRHGVGGTNHPAPPPRPHARPSWYARRWRASRPCTAAHGHHHLATAAGPHVDGHPADRGRRRGHSPGRWRPGRRRRALGVHGQGPGGGGH